MYIKYEKDSRGDVGPLSPVFDPYYGTNGPTSPFVSLEECSLIKRLSSLRLRASSSEIYLPLDNSNPF